MRSPIVLLSLSVCLAAAALVGGCGSDNQAGGTPSTADATPGSIEIAAVLPAFEYYGACGNETVDVDGTIFYPVLPERMAEIDLARYPVEDAVATASGLLRVLAPGPGDDVGTMIVYIDGNARFQSDSGRVVWLTDEEQTYNWVC